MRCSLSFDLFSQGKTHAALIRDNAVFIIQPVKISYKERTASEKNVLLVLRLTWINALPIVLMQMRRTITPKFGFSPLKSCLADP